jgi:hypothetical protein
VTPDPAGDEGRSTYGICGACDGEGEVNGGVLEGRTGLLGSFRRTDFDAPAGDLVRLPDPLAAIESIVALARLIFSAGVNKVSAKHGVSASRSATSPSALRFVGLEPSAWFVIGVSSCIIFLCKFSS